MVRWAVYVLPVLVSLFLRAYAQLGDLGFERLSLGRRQTAIPNLPAQCKNTCDPVNTVIGSPSGCTVGQCCTTSFENNYYNCFLCVGKAVNLTNWDEPQQFIDGFVVQCSIAGVVIPKKTFPQENPNRTLSTLATNKPPSTTNSQSTITGILSISSQVTVGPTTQPVPTTTSPPTGSAVRSSNGQGFLIIVLLVGMIMVLGM